MKPAGTTRREILVLGTGRMGRAYVARLRAFGHHVRLCETWPDDRRGRNAELVLLALRDGRATRALTERFHQGPPGLVVDLTTQGTDDVASCRERCLGSGIRYLAGGVTGGTRDIASGGAALLLGPGPVPTTVRERLRPLGKILEFETVRAACAAKLLHNLVLVLNGHVLAAALGLAERAGVRELEEILTAGTAGRPVRAQSVVRDYRRGPSSSYTNHLVAKDLHTILESFPGDRRSIPVDLERLARLHEEGPETPYTIVALRDQAAAQPRRADEGARDDPVLPASDSPGGWT